MPAHLPQASSSQLLKQSNTRCLHPPSSTTTLCETEDAADDFVQVVGRPLFSWSQESPIANCPGGIKVNDLVLSRIPRCLKFGTEWKRKESAFDFSLSQQTSCSGWIKKRSYVIDVVSLNLEKRRGLSKLLISFPLKEEGEKKEDFEVVFFSLHPKSEQFKLVIILRYEEREIERRK